MNERQGCMRRGCGCFWHSPLTVGLTILAIIVLIPNLLTFAISVVAARQPNPWPLFWSLAFLFFAQLGPRMGPLLWRAAREQWQERRRQTNERPYLISPGELASASDSED